MVAIAPGGGKNVKLVMPNKRWPQEYYVGLIQKILHESSARVLLFGTPDEHQLIDEIRSQCPECLEATSLSLGTVAAVFKKCSLFIGNDSGPLHIASAVGVSTISFYGPTNPKDWAPVGYKNVALYKNVACSPCYDHGKFPPCDHLDCLRSITVNEVWGQVRKKIQTSCFNGAIS